MCKKINAYFKQHVYYSATINFVTGMGVGILVTYPIVGSHPLRFGAAFLTIGVLGYLYPLVSKK